MNQSATFIRVVKPTFALAGNPNAGKTTLFNRLTGARAHVGNYPGVTVERRYGDFKYQDRTVTMVDLPGAYSLTPYSVEEKAARDYLINERPNAVIDVVDATNLERNLYLTLQFMELGIPVVIALNMMDETHTRGLKINIDRLSTLLGGAPVVPIVAKTGEGLDELMAAALKLADANKPWKQFDINYGADILASLRQFTAILEPHQGDLPEAPLRWLAIKYLENDPQVQEGVAQVAPEAAKILAEKRTKLAVHTKTTLDDDLEGLITDQRYGFLAALDKEVITRPRENRRDISENIDRVLLNRLLSPFVMLAVLYVVYEFTFWASTPFVNLFETGIGGLGTLASKVLAEGSLLHSLVTSGIIDGVGGVLSFVPLIAIMFLCIAFLEDSGYMARVAFIMDRVLRAFGLHGGSVLALIIGGGISGGCAVPGVMAARALRDPKERLATILVTPFMNCGAKVPVFAMLVGAFFASYKGLTMFSITVLGWLLALLSARVLRWFIIPGEATPFVMELPPYRLPTARGLLIHSWERTWQYIKKAGTIILAVAIVMWAAMTFPALPEEQTQSYAERKAILEEQLEPLKAQIEPLEAQLAEAKKGGLKDEAPELADFNRQLASLAEWHDPLKDSLGELEAAQKNEGLRHSLAGRLGQALEPISAPIGFTWQTDIALIAGFAAKEVVLSTLGTSYSLASIDDEDEAIKTVADRLKADPAWSPLVALSLIVFLLVYAPCFATVAVIKKEAGTGWALFSMAWNTGLAYLLSLMIYQSGKLLGY